MIIDYTINIALLNGLYEGEIEVPDNATDKEINKLVKKHVLDSISWNWTKSEDEDE